MKPVCTILVAVALLLVPFDGAGQSQRPGTIVLFVDQGAQGFTYELDSAPVAYADLLRRLGEKRGFPRPAPRAHIILHENVTFALADTLRGLVAAAGYDWPRVFYFSKDKRLMVELTYAESIPFSLDGKLPEGTTND